MSLMKKTLNSNSQSGMTLIEILVALLVLSMGLLGMAALQSQGLKLNQTAYYETKATMLAYDIIDRMRANSSKAGDYVFDDLAEEDVSSFSDDDSTYVDEDLNEWVANILDELPAGRGAIIDNGDDSYSITVQWQSRLEDDGNYSSMTVDAQL